MKKILIPGLILATAFAFNGNSDKPLKFTDCKLAKVNPIIERYKNTINTESISQSNSIEDNETMSLFKEMEKLNRQIEEYNKYAFDLMKRYMEDFSKKMEEFMKNRNTNSKYIKIFKEKYTTSIGIEVPIKQLEDMKDGRKITLSKEIVDEKNNKIGTLKLIISKKNGEVFFKAEVEGE